MLVTLAYLALPSQVFAGSAADHRLPAVLFLLLVAASRPRFPGRRAAIAAAIALTLMLAARMVVVERVWLAADSVYAAALAAIDRLPPGARLAVAYPPGAVNFTAIPTVHLATLAILRRDAFVPTLFATPGQQPIAIRAEYAAAAEAASPTLLWAGLAGGDRQRRGAALQALAAYDFVVFTDRQPVAIAPDPCLDPLELERAPRFAIFALHHGAGCDGS